jgi:hypothetical protein
LSSHSTFCDECKCYVCFTCNCQSYHLANQEELWATVEETIEQQKVAKKSKNKKRKDRVKQIKKDKKVDPVAQVANASGVARAQDFVAPVAGASGVAGAQSTKSAARRDKTSTSTSTSPSPTMMKGADPPKAKELKESHQVLEPGTGESRDETPELGGAGIDEDRQGTPPTFDFVRYLETTGSVVALSELMDELEVLGIDFDKDYQVNADREKVARYHQVLEGANAKTH